MTPDKLIRDARLAAGLTQVQLAARSGTSQSTLSAYEGGAKAPSATTLSRILAAAGRRLTAVPGSRPVVTPGRDELERRGRVLAQVLDLAERLPFRPGRELTYPPLGAP